MNEDFRKRIQRIAEIIGYDVTDNHHRLPDDLRGWYDTDKHIYDGENKRMTGDGLTHLQRLVITNAPLVLKAAKDLVGYLRLPMRELTSQYLAGLDILLDELEEVIKESEDLSRWN